MLAVQVQYLNYRETVRHDVEMERQGDINLALTARNIAETERSNRAHEDISIQNLHETIRHDQATEAIQRTQANASMMQATASQMQARTRQAELSFEQSKWREYGRTNAQYANQKLWEEKEIAGAQRVLYPIEAAGKFINNIIPF